MRDFMKPTWKKNLQQNSARMSTSSDVIHYSVSLSTFMEARQTLSYFRLDCIFCWILGDLHPKLKWSQMGTHEWSSRTVSTAEVVAGKWYSALLCSYTYKMILCPQAHLWENRVGNLTNITMFQVKCLNSWVFPCAISDMALFLSNCINSLNFT